MLVRLFLLAPIKAFHSRLKKVSCYVRFFFNELEIILRLSWSLSFEKIPQKLFLEKIKETFFSLFLGGEIISNEWNSLWARNNFWCRKLKLSARQKKIFQECAPKNPCMLVQSRSMVRFCKKNDHKPWNAS